MDATTTAVAFEASHHYRTLDWRLRLARRIVARGLPQPRHRDRAALSTAVRFLRAEARCRAKRDRTRLEERWSAFCAARRLAQTNSPLAWEVRARILAGQSDEEVAHRCGLTSETVCLFESLHFCVRDRLDATDWVAGRVIGPGLWCGFTHEEMGKLWMAIGYNAGPLILDAVLGATQKCGEVLRPTSGGRRRPSTDEDILRQKVLLTVGTMMMPADAPLRQLAQLHGRTRRREARPEPSKVAVSKPVELTAERPCPSPASRKERQNKLAPMAPTSEIS